MFFSGDPSNRKRVDLGGRSSKERDRKNLLEQTRLERNRRLWLRQQNSAALRIQKCFRAKKVVRTEQSKLRQKFLHIYGKNCLNVDRKAFGPDSDFLRQFLYFFNAENHDDFLVLLQICRLLLKFVQESGNAVRLFAGENYSSVCALVNYRVKKLAYNCIRAVHHNRNQLKDQLLLTPKESNASAIPLLEIIVLLIDLKLPWSCVIVGHFSQNNGFALLRQIILTGKDNAEKCIGSSLEHVLTGVMCHIRQKPCICSDIDPRYSFSLQILTIPFLWHVFPNLRQVFARQGMSQHYVHQMATFVPNLINFLPKDISDEFPTYACLLGNILEIGGVALSQPDCSFDMAINLAAVTTVLLEAHHSLTRSDNRENSMIAEDDITGNDEVMEVALDRKLDQQIYNSIDTRFLLQLTNILFRDISSANGPDDMEVAAVGAVCGFLYVVLNTLPIERIMTVLAYRTDLVPMLWKFMKRCQENKKWSSLSERLSYLSGDAPGWLLPLAVFCPVYKHMLMIVDNEEFYEQEKPLSLKDMSSLIILLKQALWQLLWVNHTSSANSVRSIPVRTSSKKLSIESIQQRVSIVVSELLSQLQDWNNRRQFTSPSDFHADGVNDFFISQAVIENARANEILKQAAFLIPFTSRVKIFTSQLAAARQRNGSHAVFTRNRFRIRRDHILEDAYNSMSQLSEDDLRGLIRVTFVNEFGVEEAGIDGGGIFKDFMENITRASFDVQYGLFKETADHLLYPNPGSGMIHEQHLQFFHFLGTLLAKAMFEGILVDLPFATFFLSKLKQKHNYLNDLPSLDPELYRHLIFLKRYEGDISDLELYFVILNNEYGEQTEEELLPGGKNLRVTNENVITFIHLVANHRLNSQIRQQSSHFLRGFQQLIQKDWIDMFNEHELQLLISGSLDSLDVDDLREHTNYAGTYHSEHDVIEMFWEVLKGFSMENKKKFLKFVTGCSRGPLLGFRYLEPLFCIQRAGGNATEDALDRLPTAATCMNLLKLPPYRSKDQMESKLLYAINSDAGFDLS
ncbi:putative aminoacyltransferase, E1 ubiquitin-activating enzyme [Medicago truncatula]|uniref:HECT-type E3 ubiquitin transferase n=1 Tax=Medicago truncatula TaxID=3880 RepID=G7IL24_MEDTR|nr:E3 ubiquitin-protein ligase UPL6 [Medicago truncatula]AES64909.2 E3 ubiquitin-protein ligase UPL6 [Medicago truncatula]RHN73007.1 putative aminoacyltransferase, E1 ubiquitin-activating enzyme [Medicago truncatula]